MNIEVIVITQLNKNGNVNTSAVYESAGTNVLINSEKYTIDHPYSFSGTSIDIYKDTDQIAKVIPGKTYYLIAQTNKEWNSGHVNGNCDKVTIWLYMSTTYNPTDYNYKTPVCYNSSNWISKGVWKITMPSDINMVRVRYNNYSDGSTTVTAKFWDTFLIPEEYFISTPPLKNSALHIADNFISAAKILEY